MDKIKVLNELKSLEMKKQHIEEIMDSTILNNPYQSASVITVDGGKNIKVSVTGLKALLSSEVKKTKIEYDDLLKSLIDDEGGF